MKRDPGPLRKSLALVQAGALLLFSLPVPGAAQEIKVVVPQGTGNQAGAVGAAVSAATLGGRTQAPLSTPLLSPTGLAALSGPAPVLTQSHLGPSPAAVGPLTLPRGIAPEGVEAPVKAGEVPGVESRGRSDGAGAKPSALKSLLKHGGESKKAASIEAAGGAKGAAESSFMKAAALGETGVHAGAVEAGADLDALPAAGRPGIFGRLFRRADKTKTAGREATPVPNTEPVEEGDGFYRELTLPNGMRVQLVRNPALLTATVAIGYDVGGRDDLDGKGGYAHFVEHMMFQGTKRVKNWFRMMGAMGGNQNAWTYGDHTLYVHTVPVNLLELAISLEAERMANLDITPEKVEREKRTILEEKAGADNSPFESGWNKLFGLIYSNPANHRTVLGTEDDIRGATAEGLQRFLDTYYTPDKAKVVISGNIDLNETERWVGELLGSVPGRKTPAPKPRLDEPAKAKGKRAEITDPYAAQPGILFGYRAPAYGTEEFYASGVLVELIQERLHRKLVYQEKKAVGVSMSMPYLERDPMSATGSILLGPRMTEAEALAALDAEISAIRRGEIEPGEVERIAGKLVQGLDNQLGDPYSATMLLTQAAVRGLDAHALESDMRRWSEVTPEAVRRAAEAFTARKRSEVFVRPDPEVRKEPKPFEHSYEANVNEDATAEEAALLKSLGRVEWAPVEFKTPEQFTTPNGMKVIVMPDSRRSTVYAKLAFRLGETASDPVAREKVPFVSNLLRLRTAHRDEAGMEELLGSIGGWIQADQRFDHVVFDGNSPAEQAHNLLGTLSEMVSHPYDWTDEELAVWKEWWKNSLKAGAGDPSVASHQVAVKDLLGDHPSARASVTAESIDALSAADFKKLVKSHFSPDNAVLVVAGDVDPQSVKDALGTIFEDWKPSGTKKGKEPKAEVAKQKTISVTDRPGSEQAVIRLSAISEGAGGQNAADHFPLLVASQVMGGGWGSRLFQVTRQAMGAAYNTFSQVVTDPAVAMWTFGLFTRTEKAEASLRALLEQTRRMREEAPSEVEMTSAKNALIGAFLMSLDYIGAIGDQLLGLELFEQPLESWGAYASRVSEVTGSAVREVSKKLLDEERLSISVVGDAGRIEKGLSTVRPVKRGE